MADAAKGNMEFIAAKVVAIERAMNAANDARLDSFRGLMSSLELGVASLLETVENGASITTIAVALEAVTAAIKNTKPQFTFSPTFSPEFKPQVNVPAPAPLLIADESVRRLAEALGGLQINVEAVMPSAAPPVLPAPQRQARIRSWKVTVQGQYGAPDRTMTMTPTYEE